MNRQSGEAIPEDEPVMIFRARDKHARRAIAFYMALVADPDHSRAVRHRIEQFNNFAEFHPDRMKEPDTQPFASTQPPA